MAKRSNKDNEALKRYILTGILLGGGAALATTALRTSKLNKKLENYDNSGLKHNENTLIVPVERAKTAMSKAAEVASSYKLVTIAGAGLLSYAALSALYRRIEDNRMKAIENKAYNDVINRLTSDGSEKKAQLFDGLDKFRNVAVLLTLLGSAMWMKKHLDKKNVDSEKLKPVGVDKIIMRPSDKVSVFDGESKSAEDKEPLYRRPLSGTDGDSTVNSSALKLRRILHENPGAEQAFVSNVLNASGHDKINLLQKLPVVGDIVRNETFRRMGLGSIYLPGLDKELELKSYGPSKKLPKGISEEDAAEYGISKVRAQILNDKKLRDHIIKTIAERQGLSGWTQAYLRRHPGRLLKEMGISNMPAKIALQTKAACDKNVVATSYFN